MKIEDLYHEKMQVFDNINYSVDKLRLKTYISYSKFTEIEFRFKTCWNKYVAKDYSSAQMKNFFYNYRIVINENVSFWFGYLHNTEKRSFDPSKNSTLNDGFYNFSVEFNPNKVKHNEIIEYLLNISNEWYIRSYDFAFDVRVSILDLIWDMGGKRVESIDNRGYDDKTVYIGTGDGRIKIYNKKKESNLEIIGDLTRVEISRKVEDYPINKIGLFRYDNRLPEVFLNNYVYSLSDYNDKTLLAVLYAVQNGYPLRNLTRYTRDKIKNLMKGGYKIEFNSKIVTTVIYDIIHYYFDSNNKIEWW